MSDVSDDFREHWYEVITSVLLSVRWNYLSIPKLQQLQGYLHCWSAEWITKENI